MDFTMIADEVLSGSRMDTGLRNIARSSYAKLDQEWAFVDLGTGVTNTMWIANLYTPLSAPLGLIFITDPGNVYSDNATTPPVITLEIYTATDTAGTSPLVLITDVRREFPLVLASPGRANITSTTATRQFYSIRGRSNMASGYGTIMGRLMIF